jgi:hypothetical protein
LQKPERRFLKKFKQVKRAIWPVPLDQRSKVFATLFTTLKKVGAIVQF